jgi:hypothetical protein
MKEATKAPHAGGGWVEATCAPPIRGGSCFRALESLPRMKVHYAESGSWVLDFSLEPLISLFVK